MTCMHHDILFIYFSITAESHIGGFVDMDRSSATGGFSLTGCGLGGGGGRRVDNNSNLYDDEDDAPDNSEVRAVYQYLTHLLNLCMWCGILKRIVCYFEEGGVVH